MTEMPIQVGDLAKGSIKKDNVKRGSWCCPNPVLSYDFSSRSLSAPGKQGRSATAAVDDISPLLTIYEFVKSVHNVIDILGASIGEAISGFDQFNESALSENARTFDAEFDMRIINALAVGDRMDFWRPLTMTSIRPTLLKNHWMMILMLLSMKTGIKKH